MGRVSRVHMRRLKLFLQCTMAWDNGVNFVQILPEMMQRFNQNMYNHKKPKAVEPAQEAAQPEQGARPNTEGDNGDAKMAEILNNVEEFFWRAGVSHSLIASFIAFVFIFERYISL